MTTDPPATRPDGVGPGLDGSSTTPDQTISLAALRGLRSAPVLTEPQRLELRRELEQAITPFSWFTLGVMAPDAQTAIAALRQIEKALGWVPLQPLEQAPSPRPAPAASEVPAAAGLGMDVEPRTAQPAIHDSAAAQPASSAAPSLPGFLKGNQRTGLFHWRAEAGLGVGLLITGQDAAAATASETWGPLPLDLFA